MIEQERPHGSFNHFDVTEKEAPSLRVSGAAQTMNEQKRNTVPLSIVTGRAECKTRISLSRYSRSLLWLLLIALFQSSSAQEQEKDKAPSVQMGVSTGGAHEAVKDAQHRPITAGGFVDNAPIVFADITRQSGLDKFHHRSGTPQKVTIIETPGSGVALLDYDNDGWLDIYLLNGSTFPALKGEEPTPRAMLFHNNHDGTFTDVTDQARSCERALGFRGRRRRLRQRRMAGHLRGELR